MTQRCSVGPCNQLVMSLVDKSKPSVFHKTPKQGSTGVFSFPGIPDSLKLCYYHKKKYLGLFSEQTREFPKPFWIAEQKLKLGKGGPK